MTFIQRSTRHKRKKYKIIIVFLVLIFAIINYFKIEPFHKATLYISGPIFQIKGVIAKPFENFFSYFANKKELQKLNDELKKENASLRIEVLSFESLRNDYVQILQQKKENELEIDIAKVILKPPFSSFDNLTLAGKFDNTSVGKKVYYQNIILGEIAEVTANNAIVKLYSASGYKTVAKIGDGNQFDVLGKGDGRYEIVLPKDVEIKENDPIVFPEESFVLFGVVNNLSSTDDDLFKKVLFNVPVDFKDINFVRVGTPLNMLE